MSRAEFIADTERRFLYLMIDPGSGGSYIYGLDAEPEDFTAETRRDIWRVVSGIADPQNPAGVWSRVNLASVFLGASSVLGREPAVGFQEEFFAVDEVGRRNLATEIGERMDPTQILDYLRLMKEERQRREVMLTVHRIEETVRQATGSEAPLAVVEHLDTLRSQLETEVRKNITPGTPADSAVNEYISALRQPLVAPPIQFGFPLFDRDFVLLPGSLIVLAGPRKAGKTQFLIGRLLEFAKAGEPCLFFSLEMTAQQIEARIAGWLTDTNYMRFERREATEDEIDRIASRLVQEPWTTSLIIDDRKGLDIEGIESAIRVWRLKQPGLRVVAIDYDGLIRCKRERGESMADAVFRLYDTLVTLAKRLNIILIVLAQLKNDAVRLLSPGADCIYGGVNPGAKADAVLVLNNPVAAGLQVATHAPSAHESLLRLRVDIQRNGESHFATWLAADLARVKFRECSEMACRDLEQLLQAEAKRRRE